MLTINDTFLRVGILVIHLDRIAAFSLADPDGVRVMLAKPLPIGPEGDLITEFDVRGERGQELREFLGGDFE